MSKRQSGGSIQDRIRRQRARRQEGDAEPKQAAAPKRRRQAAAKADPKPKAKPKQRGRASQTESTASGGERSHIAAHLTPELKAAVAHLAEAKGKSQSAFLRDLAQSAVNNEVRKIKRSNKRVPKELSAGASGGD